LRQPTTDGCRLTKPDQRLQTTWPCSPHLGQLAFHRQLTTPGQGTHRAWVYAQFAGLLHVSALVMSDDGRVPKRGGFRLRTDFALPIVERSDLRIVTDCTSHIAQSWWACSGYHPFAWEINSLTLTNVSIGLIDRLRSSLRKLLKLIAEMSNLIRMIFGDFPMVCISDFDRTRSPRNAQNTKGI